MLLCLKFYSAFLDIFKKFIFSNANP
jgi:hypothetical protein